MGATVCVSCNPTMQPQEGTLQNMLVDKGVAVMLETGYVVHWKTFYTMKDASLPPSLWIKIGKLSATTSCTGVWEENKAC